MREDTTFLDAILASSAKLKVRSFVFIFAALLICTQLNFAPAFAQDTPDPLAVIGVSREGNSCVIGGGNKKELLDGKAIIKFLKHKQAFSLSTLTGLQENVWTVGRPKPLGGEEDCKGQFSQELTFIPGSLKADMVAIKGERDVVISLLPKTLKLKDPTDKAYVKIVRDFLIKKGLKKPEVKIKQVVALDLNGDGTTDLLINAAKAGHGETKRGEYALVLAVVGEGDKQQLIALNAEVTAKTEPGPSALWENNIVSILDLNGDGHLEVILYGWFFFGDGWEVFTIKNNLAKRSLVCGCGG